MTKYMTVPVEPTEEMLAAAHVTAKAWGKLWGSHKYPVELYQAMLEAAPQKRSDEQDKIKEIVDLLTYEHSGRRYTNCFTGEDVTDEINEILNDS